MADAVVDGLQDPGQPSTSREFALAGVGVLAILSCLNKHVGFVLILMLPFLLLGLVRLAWIAWRRPARRRAQGVKAAAVAGAVLAVLLAHAAWQRQARAAAQQVVDAVSAYHGAHGTWPEDLALVGMDAPALRHEWRIHYLGRDGEHRVMYAATFSMFDSYGYDLDKPGWVFHAD